MTGHAKEIPTTGVIIDFASHKRAVASLCDTNASRSFRQNEKPAKARWRRWRRWRRAKLYLEFLEAQRAAALAAGSLFDHHALTNDADILAYKDLDSEFVLLDKIREAQSILLLTPVSRKYELNYKRHLIAHKVHLMVGVDPAKMAEVLNADEAYVAIPGASRNKVLLGQVRQS